MCFRFEVTDVSALALYSFLEKKQSSEYKENKIEHRVIANDASLDYQV